MEVGDSLSPADELRVLLEKYPRSVVIGRWALALKSGEKSTFENAIANQLYMNNGLSIGELYEGLNRVVTFRKQAPLPTREIVSQLIEKAGIAENRDGKFYGEGIAPGEGAKRALYQYVKNRPGQIVSKTILTNELNESGANSNTLKLYYSFEPGLRTLKGSGLIYAVGAQWTKDQERLARVEKKALNVVSKFDYRVGQDQSILATLKMGTITLESGVVAVPVGLADMLGSQSCTIRCCEKQDFSGHLSFSNRTQWFGFSSLFEHLRTQHDLAPGRTVRFEIRGHDLAVLDVSSTS
jgi:hypothetical protein